MIYRESHEAVDAVVQNETDTSTQIVAGSDPGSLGNLNIENADPRRTASQDVQGVDLQHRSYHNLPLHEAIDRATSLGFTRSPGMSFTDNILHAQDVRRDIERWLELHRTHQSEANNAWSVFAESRVWWRIPRTIQCDRKWLHD